MNNDVTAEAWQRPSPEPTVFSRPFWEATRERRLLLQYCIVAQKLQHYPRPVSIYTGRKTIEYMGGADAVIARAREDFRRGEYRWVASVMKEVVFADPGTLGHALAARIADGIEAAAGRRYLLGCPG